MESHACAPGALRLRFLIKMIRRYRYLDLLAIEFVVVLMISNLVGPKICQIRWLRPSAAEFLFPLTYICLYVATCSRRSTGTGRRAALSGLVSLPWPCSGPWADGRDAPAHPGVARPGGFCHGLRPGAPVRVGPAWSPVGRASLPAAIRWPSLNCSPADAGCETRTVGSTVTGQAVDTAVVVAVAFAGTQPILMILRMIFSSTWPRWPWKWWPLPSLTGWWAGSRRPRASISSIALPISARFALSRESA